MTYIINGKKMTLPEKVTSLRELCRHFKLEPCTVIVELNGTLYKEEAFSEVLLSTNDTIEIVHFMGGGGHP